MGFFTLYSNLTLHLALLILPSGNPLPEFSLSLPFLFIILFLSPFFCAQFLSASFSSAQCCMTIKNLLPSKGSNCSATLSLKPNKHTRKCPSIHLKLQCPQASHKQVCLLEVTVPKDFFTQVGLHWYIHFFFPCSSFFCHFITICTHPGEWAYIHAQTCMMRVGGFLFSSVIFFPYCSLCEGKKKQR